MKNAPRALRRQAVRYVLVGLAQLALDTLVYIAATALAVPVVAANLAGRAAGVALGYRAHGAWTFAGSGAPPRGRTLVRFLVAWAALTVTSTLAVALVAATSGLHGSWFAKPLVEAVLAVAGFFVQRHWVWRPPG